MSDMPPGDHGAFVNNASTDATQPKAAWAAIASLAVGVFAMVTSEFLPASLLTPVAKDLGVSDGAAGQAVTATALVAAVAAPAVVLGTARFDRRAVIWGLSSLLVISNLLAGVAWSIWVLLLARVGVGIALGGVWALAAALALRLVPHHMLPRATAVIFGGIAAATVCAPALGAFLGDLWGWRVTFTVAAGLAAVALLMQFIALPRLMPESPPDLSTFALLLKRRSIRIGFLTVLLAFSGHFAGYTYIRPFLEQVPRLDIQMISLALLAFGGGGLLGNFGGGFIAEKSVKLEISLASILLAFSAFILLVFGHSAGAALCAVTVWGFAFGALPVGTQTWTTRSGADHAESAGALLVTTTQGAIAIGAVAGGVIVDNLGIASVMIYCALAAIAGGSVMLLAPRK
ncbi:MAG: MFS transporter [Rhizobium pusense]|nr:MFS transporter [Agrobacterium pusense]